MSGGAEHLVLDESLSDHRAGHLVANIAWLARREDRPPRRRPAPALEHLTDPRAVVDRILHATALGVQGGVRPVDDSTSTVLDAGCCVLVDDWLDRADLLRGGRLVSGHDPELVVDVGGDTCVAWSAHRADSLDRGPLPHEPRVEFPAADIPAPGTVLVTRRKVQRRWASSSHIPAWTDADRVVIQRTSVLDGRVQPGGPGLLPVSAHARNHRSWPDACARGVNMVGFTPLGEHPLLRAWLT